MRENPFKAKRLELNLSQSQIAKASNLASLSIIRFEQGTPSQPSGRLCLALDLNYSATEREYFAFQKEKRQEFGNNFRKSHPSQTTHKNGAPTTQPPVGHFEYFRHAILNLESQAQACVELCIHQSTLNAFEAGKVKRLPMQIRQALDDAGLMVYYEFSLEDWSANAREQKAKAS